MNNHKGEIADTKYTTTRNGYIIEVNSNEEEIHKFSNVFCAENLSNKESLNEENEEEKKPEIEERINYNIYSKGKIKEIFEKNPNLINYLDILNKYDVSRQILKELKIIKDNQKRKRRTKLQIKKDNKDNIKLEPGRKKANDFSKINHNKNCTDNIIKKIKNKLFYYLIKWFNSILSKFKELKIYKLYILKPNQSLRTDANLKILNTKLEVFLSGKISDKYKKENKNINRHIINKIKKTECNKIIKDFLDLTFNDFLDFFTMKKTQDKRSIYFNDLLNSLLSDILPKDNEAKEEQEQYFVDFIFCLFNYKSWFLCKKSDKK